MSTLLCFVLLFSLTPGHSIHIFDKQSARARASIPIPINVSGIGGSILVDELTNLHVWVRFYEGSYYFERYVWGRYNESTETLDAFPGHSKIVPRTTGFGLDGIRNLDPTVDIWPVYDYLSYFDAIIKFLTFNGWVPGSTLFGMPWDWRQSQCWPPTLERMRDSILETKKASGRNITLISHSMGSLVVKCFLTAYPDVFEANVERWISIAAPFQGAGAKILTEFLQGYNLGNVVLADEDAKCFSLESPAVYELLPSQDFAWEQPPFIALTLNGSAQSFDCQGAPATADGRYDEAIRRALRAHAFSPPGAPSPVPQPFNDACWNLSLATRVRLASARLPASARFLHVYGVAQPTPVGLRFANLSHYRDLQTAKYTTPMADGDGTVPSESARGHGFAAAGARKVAADHMGILSHQDTLDYVLDALYGRL